MRTLQQKTQFVLMFSVCLFCSFAAMTQTYTGSVTFGNSSQYSFDYDIECDAPSTSATLTVTYTTALPFGLVPQLHLGGGVFVPMSGANPFTYNLSGLTLCDFSFSFWMAYAAGGLYQSPVPVTPNNTALPIFLSTFNVTPYGASAAALKWTSESEINSDYFRIERSADGFNWDFAGQVPAAGNSSSFISYSYLDQDLPAVRESITLVYYRLKMVDLDGTYEYSAIRAVSISALLDDEISFYPNPAHDRLIIDLTRIPSSSGIIELGIYNSAGKMMRFEQLEESVVEALNLSDLPSSTYQLVFFRKGEIIDRDRLVKKD